MFRKIRIMKDLKRKRSGDNNKPSINGSCIISVQRTLRQLVDYRETKIMLLEAH